MISSHRSVALATLAMTCACHRPEPTDPRMVSEWIHTLYGVVRAERLTPPVASRLLAYASVALYQGLAARATLPSLAGVVNGLDSVPIGAADLDLTLVAVAAERTLLDSLFREGLPTTRATLARLADSLAASRPVSGAARDAATDLGRRIGNRIVAWSRTDGFEETRGLAYVPPGGPGRWINDAPASIYGAQNLSGASQAVGLDDPDITLRPGAASDRALVMNRPKPGGLEELAPVDMAGATEPYWGRLRPFLLARWNECPISDPPPYATDPSARLYREAEELLEIERQLTPEQRAIALYWADNPGETATPAGHWIAIASQLTSQRRLSGEVAARLFLAGALAQADAFLATWGYKYQFNQIRPRTYIRRLIDPSWEPMIPTPPFPEYPSGHSTQSAAAAIALAAVLGDGPFEDSTGVAIGNPVRRFDSFGAAAEEAGMSRLYGGIHFHSGKSGGKELGTCIGHTAVARLRARGIL